MYCFTAPQILLMNYQCSFSIACLQSACLHAHKYPTVSSWERMVLSIIAHNFLEDLSRFQMFMLHSPSMNSFGTTLSHQSLLRTHTQNACVVHGGINRVRLWAFRLSAEWLVFGRVSLTTKKWLVEKHYYATVRKNCNEGTQWQQHDCSFAKEQQYGPTLALQ